MTSERFYTVDVFTQQRFNGAQIAVFIDAQKINAELRQRIARETNLSETVFLSPYKDGFEISIYTPKKEIDFGSHTTIAAACALEASQKLSTKTAETPINFYYKHGAYTAVLSRAAGQGAGLPFVRMALSTAPIVDNYVPSNSELADILSLKESDIGSANFDCKLSSNLGLFLIVPIKSLEAIRAARFNLEHWLQSSAPSTLAQQILLMSESTEHRANDFQLRLMGSHISALEDPPVGSSIPAFAAYLCAHEKLAKGTYSYTVERGLSDNRQSILHIEMDHKGKDTLNLRVGGNGIIMSQGEMYTSHLRAVV